MRKGLTHKLCASQWRAPMWTKQILLTLFQTSLSLKYKWEEWAIRVQLQGYQCKPTQHTHTHTHTHTHIDTLTCMHTHVHALNPHKPSGTFWHSFPCEHDYTNCFRCPFMFLCAWVCVHACVCLYVYCRPKRYFKGNINLIVEILWDLEDGKIPNLLFRHGRGFNL